MPSEPVAADGWLVKQGGREPLVGLSTSSVGALVGAATLVVAEGVLIEWPCPGKVLKAPPGARDSCRWAIGVGVVPESSSLRCRMRSAGG